MLTCDACNFCSGPKFLVKTKSILTWDLFNFWFASFNAHVKDRTGLKNEGVCETYQESWIHDDHRCEQDDSLLTGMIFLTISSRQHFTNTHHEDFSTCHFVGPREKKTLHEGAWLTFHSRTTRKSTYSSGKENILQWPVIYFVEAKIPILARQISRQTTTGHHISTTTRRTAIANAIVKTWFIIVQTRDQTNNAHAVLQ